MSTIEAQTSPRSSPALITWRREQPHMARAAIARQTIAPANGPGETPYLARRRRRRRRIVE